MNDYVIAGEKLYPLKEKRIKSKAGKEYSSKHVKITVATDYHSGKQIQHDYTGKNNHEVQTKIDESICLNDEQLNLLPNDITLEELFSEFFEYRAGRITERYRINLTRFTRNNILPHLGKVLVKNITKDDVIKIQRSILTTSGVATAYYLMKQVLDYACKKGYISCNPSKYAQAYSRTKREQTILKSDQIYKLLVTEKNNKYAGLFAITLLLALRAGEAAGLSWDKIDWENRTVTISQQLSHEQEIKHNTKTKVDRCITVPECAFYYFEKQREFQEHQRANNPNWNNPDNLVFTDEDGNALKRNTISLAFRRIMKTNSNPNVTLHSLRRTTATFLAENVSMMAAQYYLGHVDRNSSMSYIYPSSKNMDQLIDVMSKHFEKTFYEAGLDKIYPPYEGGQ